VTVLTPEEEARLRPLPVQLAQAIDQSLTALDQAAAEAARLSASGPQAPVLVDPILSHDLEATEVSGRERMTAVQRTTDREVAVVLLGTHAQAVTRLLE